MAVGSRLLPDGPDDVHVLVDDLVVGEAVRLYLLPVAEVFKLFFRCC